IPGPLGPVERSSRARRRLHPPSMSHLSRAHEYWLKESAVSATNPLEAHLLHEFRNNDRRNRKVRRLRCRYEDITRTVGGDELKGQVVETSAPAPNLAKVARAIAPTTFTVLLDLNRPVRGGCAVVTQRDHASAARTKAADELRERAADLIPGEEMR